MPNIKNALTASPKDRASLEVRNLSQGEREREWEDPEHNPQGTRESRDRDSLSQDLERDRDPSCESDELKEDYD